MLTKKQTEAFLKKQMDLAELIDSQSKIDKMIAEEIEAELVYEAARSLKAFFILAWDYLEPGVPYMDNWHIDCICDHLEAVHKDQILNLIVQISPRSAKSSLCNVVFPVWRWITKPATKFITAAAIDKLAIRDTVRSRTLMRTEWFQNNFAIPTDLVFAADVNQKSRYENTRNGYRIATSVRGQGIGEGFDILVVDDPHKPKEIQSKAARQAVIEWYSGTLSTRKNSPKSKKILIHQRLHEEDLIGWCIKNEPDLWEVVNIPMRYEKKRALVSILGWKDPRTEEGEVFWKQRWPEYELKALEFSLGKAGAAAQLQQNPTPPEGSIVKHETFKYYYFQNTPEQLNRYDFLFGSWDLTFTDTGESYCVGQVWGKKGANLYLIHQYRDKMDMVEQLKAVEKMKKDFPAIRTILIEKKANGSAVVSILKTAIPGLIEIDPGSSNKEIRLNAANFSFEARNVWFPCKELNPWVKEVCNELTTFPRGEFDDIVDATSQAINWARQKGGDMSIDPLTAIEEIERQYLDEEVVLDKPNSVSGIFECPKNIKELDPKNSNYYAELEKQRGSGINRSPSIKNLRNIWST